MRRKASPTSHEMRSSPEDSSGNSIMSFLGRLVMATSSSSVTPMKKKRHARRSPVTPKLLHLLL
jgi:hypothetical protein